MNDKIPVVSSRRDFPAMTMETARAIFPIMTMKETRYRKDNGFFLFQSKN
jgi:hypothetical protein